MRKTQPTKPARRGERLVRAGVGTAANQNWEWVKLDEELVVSGSADATIWDGDPLAVTTRTITVYSPPIHTTGTIPSGDWLKVEKHRNGKWYATGADCS